MAPIPLRRLGDRGRHVPNWAIRQAVYALASGHLRVCHGRSPGFRGRPPKYGGGYGINCAAGRAAGSGRSADSGAQPGHELRSGWLKTITHRVEWLYQLQ